MKKLFLWACFGLTFHAALAQSTGADLARERVKEGVALYDEGKYAEAVAKYQQALAAAPGDTYAQSELVLTYNSMGRHQEAIGLCKQVLKKPSADVTVYVTYGNSLDELNRSREAEQVYQQGLKAYPNSHMLYFNLGLVQAKRQQLAEAIVSFERGLSLKPEHVTAHMFLGVTQQNAQARIPALLAMGRYFVLEPRSERAGRTLGFFDQTMTLGVTRTGATEINIAMTMGDVGKVGKDQDKPDNFAMTEMLFNLGIAHSLSKDSGTVVSRFAGQFAQLCESLAAAEPDKQKGFVWQFYVPYYVEMHKKGFVPAFAYLPHASRAATDPDVQQWLASHATEVQVFEEWSKNYTWPGVRF